MDIEVLGEFGVRVNGVSVTPTAPKPRQVLALLALHADRVVPVASLTEELWGQCPPRSARTTLQTYVLQLRDLISGALASAGDSRTGDGAPGGGGSAKEVLVTSPGGYVLVSGGGTSDVGEFELLAGRGYRAMDAGDFAGAARVLRQSLELWTGGVLADVQAGALLQMHVRRLEESRLCALDQRIEADLRLGRHREVLGELTVLVSRYRTHENLHGQLMLALHRSGRRSEALEVYQRLRGTLVRELGLEPSAALRRLQRSILTAQADTVPDNPATRTGERLSRVAG